MKQSDWKEAPRPWAAVVGENMKRAREALGITQAEAASRMGLGGSTQISLAESGKRPASNKLLARCAALYGLTEDELRAGAGAKEARKTWVLPGVTIRSAAYAAILASPGISSAGVRAQVLKQLPDASPKSIYGTLKRMKLVLKEIVSTRVGPVLGAQKTVWRVADESAARTCQGPAIMPMQTPAPIPVAVQAPSLDEVLALLRKSLGASSVRVSRAYVSCAVALLSAEERIAA